MHNLTTLASVDPDILLGPPNLQGFRGRWQTRTTQKLSAC